MLPAPEQVERFKAAESGSMQNMLYVCVYIYIEYIYIYIYIYIIDMFDSMHINHIGLHGGLFGAKSTARH